MCSISCKYVWQRRRERLNLYGFNLSLTNASSWLSMSARSLAVAGIPAKLRLAGWPGRQIEYRWQMVMPANLFYFFFSSYFLSRYNYNNDFLRRYATSRCLTIVPCSNSKPRFSTSRCPGQILTAGAQA